MLLAMAYVSASSAQSKCTKRDDFGAQTNCSHAHFEDGDLSGIYAPRITLHYADLEGSTLAGAQLEGAYIECANLSWTKLTNADLQRARIGGTTFIAADLTGVNLRRTTLYPPDECSRGGRGFEAGRWALVNLTNADLRSATFAGPAYPTYDPRPGDPFHGGLLDMRHGIFIGAKFLSTIFLGIDLRQSVFRGTKVSVRMEHDNLACSDFTGATLKGDANETNFAGADFTDAKFEGFYLTNVNMRHAVFKRAEFTRTTLLLSSDLTHADFTDAKLGDTVLTKSNLTGAIWIDGTTCGEGSIGECKSDGIVAPPRPPNLGHPLDDPELGRTVKLFCHYSPDRE